MKRVVKDVYPIEDKDPICERLRHIAVGLGLSYEEIARRSGLHPNTIWHILKGPTVSPRFCTVARIVIALDQGETSIIEQEQRPVRRGNVVPLRVPLRRRA